MTLSIPALDPDADTLSAALAYAGAGWYVLPINRATKHAGSVLGKGWPAKTSRDPKVIVAWFAGADHGLALHCGRSGAVVFDVDEPDLLPRDLVDEFEHTKPPMQATRAGNSRRGHYLFLQPDGRSIGNSTGQLGGAWGEVRGRNGIIVAAPTPHEKAAAGGRYQWLTIGELPVLAPRLAAMLPDQQTAEDAVTDAEIKVFLDQHTASVRPELIDGIITSFRTDLERGEGRHPSAIKAVCWAVRESRAGLFSARTALEALWPVFRDALRDEPGRNPSNEWRGLVAWAIGQGELDNAAATYARLTAEEPFAADEDSTSEPSRGALTFLTVPELRARVAAAGPRKYLLRGYWPQGDYGVHAGDMKAQKTWTTIDAAVSAASGTNWLGLVPVEVAGYVIMFAGEGGEADLLRRIDAVATSRGLDADDLPIVVCCRAPHLSNAAHLGLMAEQLDKYRPVMTTIDPLYLAARGAKLGDLYSMGALLEAPQHLCQAAGSSLWVAHHQNRKEGRGALRMSGAGPAEWGRVLVSATVISRRTDPATAETTVVTELDTIGGSIPGGTLRVVRRIRAEDPENLDSPLHYTVVTTEGEESTGDDDMPPSRRKLLEALRALGSERTGSELVDWIVTNYGHGLGRQTVSGELGHLAEAGYIDRIDPTGPGQPAFWMLTEKGRGQ